MTIEAEEKVRANATCSRCGETVEVNCRKDGSPCQPKGWHRLGADLWCAKCWHDNFSLRSIELPVASVIAGYADGAPGQWNQAACAEGWTAFRAALRQSSDQARRFSNDCLSEHMAADRQPIQFSTGENGKQKVKLPPLPDVETYRLGRARYPELDSQSLGSLRQKARAKYKEQRFGIRITGKESLSSYRRGLPVPIPAKDARLEVSHRHQEAAPEEERASGRGQPFLFVRVAGRRFTLRLRSGAGGRQGRFSFWKKIAALEKIEAGRALQGEVKLYERRAPSAAHRNGSNGRAAAGSPSYTARVFAAVACWLPKEKGRREAVEIRVVTSAERLWNVFVGSQEERPWLLNEDQARRWVVARGRQLQRLSEDAKFERRSRLRGQPLSPADLAAKRQQISETYKKRLADWAHKASTMLANFAKRQSACRLVYDDRDKSFCSGLPFFKLATMLADKLNRFGIEYVHATASDENEPE